EGGLGREIGKRVLSKTSALADLSAKCVIGSGNIQVTPEIHAGVDYAFTVKNSDTVITIFEGIDPIITQAAKSPKEHYNFGASVSIIGQTN
ncbi:hypothetical protein OAP56_02585, partial [Rickettsiaceae bacterium]|nr:hypothetical protein [Rickettsiaceae bacterium]